MGTCTIAGCRNVLTSFSFKLCDQCASKYNECKWCRVSLSGGSSSPTSSTARFTVVRDTDNGTTVKNMQVGEEVHVILSEDRYSSKIWGVKSTGYGLNHLTSRTIVQVDQTNYQYQDRTLVFECWRSGTYDIELHELVGQWSWSWYGGGTWSYQPAANGKTWKCSVHIK